MISRFPDGYQPPRNRQAALLHAGGPSPIGSRQAGGISAFAGTPRIAIHTGRPGPQPTTTSQAIAVRARTSQSQRAVQQTLRHIQEVIHTPYSTYQPNTPGREPWRKTHDEFGQPWFATQVREIWVYAHQINNWGDQEFILTNPQTGTRVHFIPTGYIPAHASIQAIASATGEFGRIYRNTLGVVVVVGTGGAALGAGAGAVALEYAAPYLTTEALTGFGIRAGTDGAVQLVSNFAVSKGSFINRSKYALVNINGTSMLVAGVLNTEGLELKLPAKLLMAGGTAAAGNLVTMSYANLVPYGSIFHGVNLHDEDERNEFFVGVGLSAVLDVGKEKASDWLAPGVAKLARRTMAVSSGQAVSTTLRVVRAQRFVLPLSFSIGTVSETGKKLWEEKKKGKEEVERQIREAASQRGLGTRHYPKK